MHKKNEIRLEHKNEITLLHIHGDITAHSEPEINQAYETANARGHVRKFIIRFDEKAYINSGGIAVLIQVLARTRKNSQQISITGLSDHFKKIFNMVGITKFANIYNSIDDALQSMS
jgi:anti-anti-sigma factor